MLAALSLRSWVTVQTGESQEEQVNKRVTEPAMETHEEAAAGRAARGLATLVPSSW